MIGALAAAAHRVYGNVDLANGLLVAAPAIAGVLAGTAVQQRIPERAVAAAFVVLLGFAAGSAGTNMERALELSFAAVQLGFAWQLAGKAGLR